MAYQLNLSFSISDLVSVFTLLATFWIARQTHQIQKRQLENEEFPKKQEIYRAIFDLLSELALSGKLPSKEAYSFLADGRRNVRYFDNETNELIQQLRGLHDYRLTLGEGGLLSSDQERIEKLAYISTKAHELVGKILDRVDKHL